MPKFVRHLDEEVVLVQLVHKHAEDYYSLIDANRERLAEWFGWVEPTQSHEDVREFIDEALKLHEENGEVAAGIWYKGQPAGFACVCHIDTQNNIGEIMYWLGEGYEGEGIITKACRALLDYAFFDLDLNRVKVRIRVGNEPSKAVAERLGFTYEGTLRQSEYHNDEYFDMELYSMLRDEWAASFER